MGNVLKAIVGLCWLFFALCITAEIHWGLAKMVELHGWAKMDASAWAAWVQAIGSVLAILAAVGVAWHQAESQRRRDEEREAAEARAILKCLRADMESHFDQVKFGIAPYIHATEAGAPVLSVFPVSEDPFSIYNAMLPRLGLIPNDELRSQIVRSYAAAKSFVLTVRCNNDLVTRCRVARELHDHTGTDASKRALASATQSRDQYGDKVRESYCRVMDQAAVLQAMLDRI